MNELPPDRLVRAEDLVTQAVEELGIPGAALVVVHRGRPVLTRTWGITGGARYPVTAETPFVIGSNSKALTAYGLMRLIEEGDVELDASVRDFLPAFRLADGNPAEAITVRHLLTHRSGLSAEAGFRVADRGLQEPEAMQALLRELGTVSMTFRPGEAYEYSAANYLILGALIEEVSGQSFSDFMRRTVFEPLAMEDAAADHLAAESAGWQPGYRSWFGHPVGSRLPYDTSGAPYGYIAASARDIGRFLAALQRPSLGVLSPESVATYLQPLTETGNEGVYGFGWRFSSRGGGGTRIWHGGATADFRSEVFLLKEPEIGVALLTNRSNGLEVAALGQVARALENVLLGEKPGEIEAATVPWRWSGSAMVGVLASFVFYLAWKSVRSRDGYPRTGLSGAFVGVTGVAAGLVLVPLSTFILPVPLRTFCLMVPDLCFLLVAAAALLLTGGLVALIGRHSRVRIRGTSASC